VLGWTKGTNSLKIFHSLQGKKKFRTFAHPLPSLTYPIPLNPSTSLPQHLHGSSMPLPFNAMLSHGAAMASQKRASQLIVFQQPPKEETTASTALKQCS